MYENSSSCLVVQDSVLIMGTLCNISLRYEKKHGHSFRRWAKVSSSSLQKRQRGETLIDRINLVLNIIKVTVSSNKFNEAPHLPSGYI